MAGFYKIHLEPRTPAGYKEIVPITWRTNRKKQAVFVSPECPGGIVDPEVAPHRRRRAAAGAEKPRFAGLFSCAPGTCALLEVKVLP
jgi:hypothetical protein